MNFKIKNFLNFDSQQFDKISKVLYIISKNIKNNFFNFYNYIS